MYINISYNIGFKYLQFFMELAMIIITNQLFKAAL